MAIWHFYLLRISDIHLFGLLPPVRRQEQPLHRQLPPRLAIHIGTLLGQSDSFILEFRKPLI